MYHPLIIFFPYSPPRFTCAPGTNKLFSVESLFQNLFLSELKYHPILIYHSSWLLLDKSCNIGEVSEGLWEGAIWQTFPQIIEDQPWLSVLQTSYSSFTLLSHYIPCSESPWPLTSLILILGSCPIHACTYTVFGTGDLLGC